MSILLIDPPEELGAAVVRRLVDDGDEVRVLIRERGGTQYWKELGAHVAVGDPADDDLVERAALNVRTIVLLNWDGISATNAEATIAAAHRSGVDRVIATAKRRDPEATEILDRIDVDYIILIVLRRLLASAVDPEEVGRAVSASDDLAGNPRLVIDVSDRSDRQLLRLVER